MGPSYVTYDAKGVEPSIPDEEAKTDEIISLINDMQQKNFETHRHYFRGTHVKVQAIVKGTLTILPDLPQELAQGIASPENAKHPHPVGIRYANEPSWLQDDRTPAPRGCGMKIFNVHGSNFMDPSGSSTHTQDMTFNNAPIIELRDVNTCVEIFRIRNRNFRSPEKIPDELKKRDDTDLQMAIYQLPNHHFMGYTYYSQSAYRWGPYIVKYGIFPTGEFQTSLTKSEIDNSSDPAAHAKWLEEYFKDHDATYDLRVQLCRDLNEQPVEDAAQQWDEEKFPYRTVGQIVLPKGQNVMDPERRRAWDDQMLLNVWYGLEEHRPLGSINRLRKRLYEKSKEKRERGNARKVDNISSIDQIP